MAGSRVPEPDAPGPELPELRTVAEPWPVPASSPTSRRSPRRRTQLSPPPVVVDWSPTSAAACRRHRRRRRRCTPHPHPNRRPSNSAPSRCAVPLRNTTRPRVPTFDLGDPGGDRPTATTLRSIRCAAIVTVRPRRRRRSESPSGGGETRSGIAGRRGRGGGGVRRRRRVADQTARQVVGCRRRSRRPTIATPPNAKRPRRPARQARPVTRGRDLSLRTWEDLRSGSSEHAGAPPVWGPVPEGRARGSGPGAEPAVPPGPRLAPWSSTVVGNCRVWSSPAGAGRGGRPPATASAMAGGIRVPEWSPDDDANATPARSTTTAVPDGNRPGAAAGAGGNLGRAGAARPAPSVSPAGGADPRRRATPCRRDRIRSRRRSWCAHRVPFAVPLRAVRRAGGTSRPRSGSSPATCRTLHCST
jgi:hypothetical protein